MHATAQEGCMDTARESALEVDSGRTIFATPGLKPTPVLRLAFRSGALPAELSQAQDWQASPLDSCIPDSIAEFADDIAQTEETLVDGTALPKTITRILCSLLGTRQINKVLQGNHSFHNVTKLLFLTEAVTSLELPQNMVTET